MDVSSIEMDGYKTSKLENEELWDPGGDPQRTELINIALSSPLHALLSTANMCDRESDERSDDNDGEESMSRTDLDSHANMVLAGQHAYILSDMGRTHSRQTTSRCRYPSSMLPCSMSAPTVGRSMY